MVFRRLFIDIETSPNTGYFWRSGYRINVPYQAITKEGGIICICWKWADEKKVHNVTWKKGNDEQVIRKIASVINEADEVVTHNGEKFDLPHIRTRALAHGLRINDHFGSTDTLKVARYKYRFNSNRLDYLGQYLGLGGKIHTPPDLWGRVMDGDKKALSDMVTYCERDVRLLEKVFGRLMEHARPTVHVGVAAGGDRLTCPNCGSPNTKVNMTRTTAVGTIRRLMYCKGCHRFFTVADGTYRSVLKVREMIKPKP